MSGRWQEDLISHTLALSQIQGGEGTSLQKHSAVRSHRSRLGMGDLGSMSCRLFRAWLPTPNASRVSTNTCTQLSEEPGTAQEEQGHTANSDTRICHLGIICLFFKWFDVSQSPSWAAPPHFRAVPLPAL